MTAAGKRARLITIERPNYVSDDYGGQTESGPATPLGIAWAEVLFGTGQERREAAQESGSQAATFLCLWTPTLASAGLTDRIQFDGDAWDITSIAPIGLNKELHFTATRVV